MYQHPVHHGPSRLATELPPPTYTGALNEFVSYRALNLKYVASEYVIAVRGINPP